MSEEESKSMKILRQVAQRASSEPRRQLPPEMRKRLERLRQHRPSIESIIAFAAWITREIETRDAEIAALNGRVQKYLVLRDFVHTARMKWYESRIFEFPEPRSIGYGVGTHIYLRPIRISFGEDRTLIWVWIEPRGWIFKDFELEKLKRDRNVREIEE